MSSTDASAAEFGKFCKFFTIRLVQAVVQSRLGQALRTASSVEGTDWFNVRVEELGEVTGEIRAATQGRFPPQLPALSLHFQLQTSEGEHLPLESWALTFDASACDPSVAVRGAFYHQLSTLLRSAIAAARLTPAYRYYARRQGPDSFILCYSLAQGLPDLSALGSEPQSLTLGVLPSPFGTLTLNLHYRTKMVLADQPPPSPDRPPEEISPPRPLPSHTTTHPFVANSPGSDEGCFSLFSTSPPSFEPSPFGPRKTSVTFPANLSGQQDSSSSASTSSHPGGAAQDSSAELRKRGSSGALFSLELSGGSADSQTKNSQPDHKPPEPSAATVAEGEEGEEDEDEEEEEERPGEGESFPFAALLTASSAPNVSSMAALSLHSEGPRASESGLTSPTKAGGGGVPRIVEDSREELEEEGGVGGLEDSASDDSFVKVEAGPVFAPTGEGGSADLGVLVEQWRRAPAQLESFAAPLHSPRPAADGGIAAQLSSFRSLQGRFDSFITTLQQEPEDD